MFRQHIVRHYSSNKQGGSFLTLLVGLTPSVIIIGLINLTRDHYSGINDDDQ
jgi:hypothetical protein